MSLVELIFFLISGFIITFYALFYAYYLFLFWCRSTAFGPNRAGHDCWCRSSCWSRT